MAVTTRPRPTQVIRFSRPITCVSSRQARCVHSSGEEALAPFSPPAATRAALRRTSTRPGSAGSSTGKCQAVGWEGLSESRKSDDDSTFHFVGSTGRECGCPSGHSKQNGPGGAVCFFRMRRPATRADPTLGDATSPAWPPASPRSRPPRCTSPGSGRPRRSA